MFKKLSVFLSLLMIICMLSVGTAVMAAVEEVEMSFDEDGTADLNIEAYAGIFDNPAYFKIQYPENAVVSGDSDQYLDINGYFSMRNDLYITDPYEFSIDVNMLEGNFYEDKNNANNIGFFVRGVEPYAKERLDKAGAVITLHYHEADYYAYAKDENGAAMPDARMGIGGSGIAVYFKADGIRVELKVYREAGTTVTGEYYDFPLPANFAYGDMFNLKFTDNGTEVCIYINDALLCEVALSEPNTVYPLDEGTDVGEFFGKAVISDANGNVVKEIENTRVNSEGSQVAIGCRNMHVQVDNIVITDYTAPADPSDPSDPSEPTTPTDPEDPAPSDPTTPNTGSSSLLPILAAAVLLLSALFVTKKKRAGI